MQLELAATPVAMPESTSAATNTCAKIIFQSSEDPQSWKIKMAMLQILRKLCQMFLQREAPLLSNYLEIPNVDQTRNLTPLLNLGGAVEGVKALIKRAVELEGRTLGDYFLGGSEGKAG